MGRLKQRIWLILGALALNGICHLLTVIFHIPTTFLKVGGSYLAVLGTAVAVSFLPLRLHVVTQIFLFFAASMGCCMNLYTHWAGYDLLIHYLSGIVLAVVGYELDKKLMFGLLFSWAGAGLWEIFEFSCDVLLHAGMQGNTLDTMTDMLAGFLGGLTWLAGAKLKK